MLWRDIKKWAPAVIEVFGALILMLVALLFSSLGDLNTEEKRKENDPEELPDHDPDKPLLDLYMNHKGNYCGKDKINFY